MDEVGEGTAEARADLRERAELDAVDGLALVELLDGVAVDAGAADDFGEGADFAVVHDFAEVAADCSCLHRLASLVTDRRVHRAVRAGFAGDGVLDEHRAGERVGKSRTGLLLLGIRLRLWLTVSRGLCRRSAR